MFGARGIAFILALRYFRGSARRLLPPFATMTAICAIGLGVMALIVSNAVMRGFEVELQRKILQSLTHINVRAQNPIADWEPLREQLLQDRSISGVAPLAEKAIWIQADAASGAMLQGIEPDLEPGVSELATHLQTGTMQSLQAGSFNVVLGSGLAKKLGSRLGDKVNLISTESRESILGFVPRSKVFTVSGIAHFGFPQVDQNFAYIHLADAQKFLRLGQSISSLRVRLDDPTRAMFVAAQLNTALPDGVQAQDWASEHKDFFDILRIEKFVMFVLMSLVIAVSAFGMASALLTLVREKRSDIAMLQTMGMDQLGLRRVFFLLGSMIAIIGTIGGVAVGSALAWKLPSLIKFYESVQQTQLMSAEGFFVSGVPVALEFVDVMVIAGFSVVLCLSFSLYPAIRAGALSPAQVLRSQ